MYQSIFTHVVFESRLQSDVHKHVVSYLVMLMNCNYCEWGCLEACFILVMYFKKCKTKVMCFAILSDVFGSILQLWLQSDVHKHVVCYLVMLMNCNYCDCGVLGSVFYFGDVFEKVQHKMMCFAIAYWNGDVFQSQIRFCNLVM